MSSTPKHMPLVKLCGILHGFFHLKLPEKRKRKKVKRNKKKRAQSVLELMLLVLLRL